MGSSAPTRDGGSDPVVLEEQGDEHSLSAVAGVADTMDEVFAFEGPACQDDEVAPTSVVSYYEHVEQVRRAGRAELREADLELGGVSSRGGAGSGRLHLDATKGPGRVVEDDDVITEVDFGYRDVPAALGNLGHDGELTSPTEVGDVSS